MHAGSATLLCLVKHNNCNSKGCEFEDSAHQQNRRPQCLWDTEGFLSDRRAKATCGRCLWEVAAGAAAAVVAARRLSAMGSEHRPP